MSYDTLAFSALVVFLSRGPQRFRLPSHPECVKFTVTVSHFIDSILLNIAMLIMK